MSNTPGRNEPCPCGSGKKYKRCCLPTDEADERERARQQGLFVDDVTGDPEFDADDVNEELFDFEDGRCLDLPLVSPNPRAEPKMARQPTLAGGRLGGRMSVCRLLNPLWH